MAQSFDFAALDALVDQRLSEAFGYQAEERAIARAAAMTVNFREGELLSRLRAAGNEISERDLAWLRENTRAVAGGRWTLSPSTRRSLLARIEKTSSLDQVYSQFGPEDTPEAGDRFYELLIRNNGEGINPEDLSLEEVQQLLTVIQWLDETSLGLKYADLRQNCAKTLETVELLHQMIRHTQHFSGRTRELKVLEDFVFATTGPADPLLIFGIGGIGKSTLVSKFILDHGIFTSEEDLPFVYLDFDRAGMSIAEPVHLAIEALRQLKLQFSADQELFDRLSAAHGDFIAFADRSDEPDRKWKVSQKESRSFVLKNMAGRYLSGAQFSGPVLVVLDSFEEAQFRASEGELHNLLDFLDEIRTYVPSLRLMIVGRSDLVATPFALQQLEVGDFDADAAAAYLAEAGVPGADLRALIFSRVGGNPLNLKLAAVLAATSENAGEELLQQLDENRIQEQLVRRNLAHIPDADAQKLAEPGLLLRRITPAVIREVMAGPCGLGAISEWRSEELFQILRRITFLVEDRGGVIQFRRDVRMALREVIWARSQVQATALTTAVIDYYALRPDAASQAEYYYHRLLTEDPARIDKEDPPWAELRPYLENAIAELPPDAAALLGLKFNLRIEKSITEGQSDTAWENTTAANFARGMQEGTTLGVLEDLWKQMAKHRTNNSYFNRQLGQLAIRLGHLDAAEQLLAAMREDSLYSFVVQALQLDNYRLESRYYEAIASALPGMDPETLPFSSWSAFVEVSFLLAKAAGLADQDVLPLAQGFLIPAQESLKSLLLTNGLVGSSVSQREEPPQYAAVQPRTGHEPSLWKPLEIFRELRWLEVGTHDADFASRYLVAMQQIAAAYGQERDRYLRLVHQIGAVEQSDFSQTLFNEYHRIVSDVSWPSAWNIARVDVADFLLAYHCGNLATAEQTFFPSTVTAREVEDTAPSTSPAPATAPEMSKKVAEIRTLLASDRIQDAIQALDELSSGNRDLKTTVTLMASRYNRLAKGKLSGTLNYTDQSTEDKQINAALLRILDDLEEKGPA